MRECHLKLATVAQCPVFKPLYIKQHQTSWLEDAWLDVEYLSSSYCLLFKIRIQNSWDLILLPHQHVDDGLKERMKENSTHSYRSPFHSLIDDLAVLVCCWTPVMWLEATCLSPLWLHFCILLLYVPGTPISSLKPQFISGPWYGITQVIKVTIKDQYFSH